MKFNCAHTEVVELHKLQPRKKHHNKSKPITSKDILIFKEYLKIDKKTGRFSWIKKPARNIALNNRVGTVRPDGYLRILLKGKSWLAHRVAYAMYHGPFVEDIDHIDNNKLNNSKENLRKVSHSENLHNRKRSKTSGVYRDKRCPNRPFAARLNFNKKQYNLGYFKTKKEALSAVNLKREELIFGRS